jgi:hypothetical protein
MSQPCCDKRGFTNCLLLKPSQATLLPAPPVGEPRFGDFSRLEKYSQMALTFNIFTDIIYQKQGLN